MGFPLLKVYHNQHFFQCRITWFHNLRPTTSVLSFLAAQRAPATLARQVLCMYQETGGEEVQEADSISVRVETAGNTAGHQHHYCYRKSSFSICFLLLKVYIINIFSMENSMVSHL